jgi:hypothetical protein
MLLTLCRLTLWTPSHTPTRPWAFLPTVTLYLTLYGTTLRFRVTRQVLCSGLFKLHDLVLFLFLLDVSILQSSVCIRTVFSPQNAAAPQHLFIPIALIADCFLFCIFSPHHWGLRYSLVGCVVMFLCVRRQV